MLLCTYSTHVLGGICFDQLHDFSLNKHEVLFSAKLYQTYKIRFHSFSKNEKLKKTWSNFTGRPGFWTPGKFSGV